MRKIFFILLTAILILTSSVEAAKVDKYRDAIVNKNFMLKYEVAKVPVYQSMRSGTLTFRENLLGSNEEITKSLHHGIVCVSNENRYIEIYKNAYETTFGNISNLTLADRYIFKPDIKNKKIKVPERGNCILFKNGEIFQFIWAKDGDKRKYLGKIKYWEYKSGEIKANADISRTPYQDLVEEYNYGVPEISLVIMPLLPREKVIATPWTPDYKFFSSGSLNNGLTYEDFVSNRNNFFSAVRYYFNGNDMVKVAIASYIKENGKIQSYEKKVINITEFSTNVDQNYLKLPESLKDTTERNKEAKK